ncbi:MAG: hypothetical protein ACLPH3_23170 [Terracidiphilus sp.]
MKKTLSGCAFTLQQLENSYGRDRRAYRLRFAKNNQERGGLSEIGGQMNETEEESVAVVEPQGKKTEEPDPARNGAQSFRNEACEILQLEGREIVKALAAEAKKGHIQCAKFLYDLASGRKLQAWRRGDDTQSAESGAAVDDGAVVDGRSR